MNKISYCCCSSLFFLFFAAILALPIESEIMDGFWCSRCLNDRIDLPDMIGSFASGATASMVAKSGTKKIIPLLRNFNRDFALSRGKIWLWLFYNFFCVMIPWFYTKNFKSFWAKLKAWQRFSRFKFKSKISIEVAHIFNFQPGLFSSIVGHKGGSGATGKWPYHVGEIDTVI